MGNLYDRSELEAALSQLESAAVNFSQRFISDGRIRTSYIRQTKELTHAYRSKVASGALSAEEAAKQVQMIRNEILEAQRLRTSDIGRAMAVNLKNSGPTLTELAEKYAKNKFGTSFANLSATNQNKVFLEIIESSGRSRPAMNVTADRLSKLGRSFVVVTVGIAVYNIAASEDKTKATAREGVIIGGGFAGGAAGGAVAGLVCGPGAPLCVTIGVFIGGALGALGADFTFGWVF